MDMVNEENYFLSVATQMEVLILFGGCYKSVA